MQRRNLLAAVAALSTGSAAAIGTGAVSTQESERNVDVDVVSDSNGGVALLADETDVSSLENTEYVEVISGQLSLQFDGLSGSSGLNPDSTYYFDNMFRIQNETQDQLSLDIDESGLDNSSAFNFYSLSMAGSLLWGRSSDNMPGITSGNGCNIGVKITTPDNCPDDWETGSINIIAKDSSDKSV